MNQLELDFHKCMLILQSDWPVRRVNATFFHARAHRDDDGLLELIREMHREQKMDWVVINGSDGRTKGGSTVAEVWPGVENYDRRLGDVGVAMPVISEPAFDTKEENETFLKISMIQRWRSGVILAQPHQLPRAMLGMIRSMTVHDYPMRIYCVAPKTVDWFKPVYGSLGRKLLPRIDHINEELTRISDYQAKGDLATFDELFAYLQNRSAIV